MTARDDCLYYCVTWPDCDCGREKTASMMMPIELKEVMQSDADASVSRPVAPPGLSSGGPGVSKVALPEPDFIGVSKDGIPQGKCYSLATLESYAAARVAEATAELRDELLQAGISIGLLSDKRDEPQSGHGQKAKSTNW